MSTPGERLNRCLQQRRVTAGVKRPDDSARVALQKGTDAIRRELSGPEKKGDR